MILGELGTTFQEEWRRIPHVTIHRLIGSMQRRCTACCDNRDGPTRYSGLEKIDVDACLVPCGGRKMSLCTSS